MIMNTTNLWQLRGLTLLRSRSCRDFLFRDHLGEYVLIYDDKVQGLPVRARGIVSWGHG
jgi:hypothetical protein